MIIRENECRKRILLVDDSNLTSTIMSEFLENRGYDVQCLSTGEEAVILLNETKAPDLILMDIELAGKMSGIDAAREIQKKHDAPIVFFTANISEEIREAIREVKAYGYLMKGMDRIVMLSTIEMAIQLHEVHESAAMYRYIIENQVNEVYLLQKDDFMILQSNRCAQKRTGYSEQEWKELNFLFNKPHLSEQDFSAVLEKLVLKEMEQIYLQTLCVRKDQSNYPVEINIQKIRYNREICFLATVSDLTEKKIMKDQLSDREAMLDAIVNSAQDGLIILDDKGQVILWNNAAERIFGYDKNEILGRKFQEYCSPRKMDGFVSTQDLICKNMIGRTVEIQSRKKTGQELELEVSISDFWMGKNHQIIVLARDIGQRKKWQMEIQESRMQYLELAENSPIGIARCDREGNVEYINETGARYFGVTPSDIIGKYNLLLESEMEMIGVAKLLHQCMKDNSLVKGETKYRIAGKDLYIRLQVKPMEEVSGGKSIQLIIDDITELKVLEYELRKLSQTDPLTGAYNRRYFMDTVNDQLKRLDPNKDETVYFVMMDIDRFKQINDRYGHQAGDDVLIQMVNIIRSQMREGDLLSRWGGEEFVMMLNRKNMEEATVQVSEMRKAVAEALFWGNNKITASFGVVKYNRGDSLDSTISRADDYMYEAKNAGRNCIMGEGK